MTVSFVDSSPRRSFSILGSTKLFQSLKSFEYVGPGIPLSLTAPSLFLLWRSSPFPHLPEVAVSDNFFLFLSPIGTAFSLSQMVALLFAGLGLFLGLLLLCNLSRCFSLQVLQQPTRKTFTFGRRVMLLSRLLISPSSGNFEVSPP